MKRIELAFVAVVVLAFFVLVAFAVACTPTQRQEAGAVLRGARDVLCMPSASASGSARP